MEFEPCKEAGTIEIDYTGEPLNLESFGYFHLNVQQIINNVVIGLIESTGRPVPGVWPERQRAWVRDQLVKAEINDLQIGSLNEIISFATFVMAEPDLRAILQNLAANVVWAISTSGLPNVIRTMKRPSQPMTVTSTHGTPDVGRNLANIMLAIADSNGFEESELTFRYKSPAHETMEVTLKIEGKHQQWDDSMNPARKT